ncbi:hypothetical protein [Streptomyces sp. NPDC015131]|uniref:hypothetical protein n=1 Tax=Streptomyces sp. NPDC015131 TaxID=3364941 RepID=UPI0036FFB187
MAISFVAAEEDGGTANTDTLTIAKPTGLQVDDIMVAFTSSNLQTVTAPSGWTQHDSDDATSGAAFRNYVFYKVATSGDVAASNFTFTVPGATSPLVGAIAAYRGVDTDSPIHGSALTHSTTAQNQAGPNISTTSRALVLHFRTVREDSTTHVTFTASGVTERFDVGNNGATISYAMALYDTGSSVAGGTQNGITINGSAAPTDGMSRTIGLREITEGPLAVTAPSATSAASGTVTVEGTLTATAPMPSVAFAAEHIVPAEGALAVTAPAPQATINVASDVFGSMAVSPSPTVSITAETRPFGGRVISIAPEDRTLRAKRSTR